MALKATKSKKGVLDSMTPGRNRTVSRYCNHSMATGQEFRRLPKVTFAARAALPLIAFVVVLLIGCSDARPRRVPVSGQVLIDGKPLTYGDLKFVPEGARPSYAKLDSNGRFTLTCYDGNDGAVPGLHRVGISGSEVKQEQTVWHAPIKYANFRSSGITVQIDGPMDSLVIELGSDGRQATVRQGDP
jgi:hypothetical protein